MCITVTASRQCSENKGQFFYILLTLIFTIITVAHNETYWKCNTNLDYIC